MSRFENKVVMVTGASRGIGLATTQRFAREGAIVVATDVEKADLDAAVAALVAEGWKAESVAHDVSDQKRWGEVIEEVQKNHGRLDVLVNNVGTGRFADIESTTVDYWRKVASVNLDGVLFGTQAGIAAMKQRGGVIVNVASVAANIAEPLLAACATTLARSGLRGNRNFPRDPLPRSSASGLAMRLISLQRYVDWSPTLHLAEFIWFWPALGRRQEFFGMSSLGGLPWERFWQPCVVVAAQRLPVKNRRKDED